MRLVTQSHLLQAPVLVDVLRTPGDEVAEVLGKSHADERSWGRKTDLSYPMKEAIFFSNDLVTPGRWQDGVTGNA